MTLTASLFEAFLKCPTKCWLRFTCEPPSGNAYAEWVQSETESYRAKAAALCSSRREEAHYSAEPLKTAKWQFAVDIPARTELRSSRGNEAQTSPPDNSQSLLTSAATIETCLHAIERMPSAGRGQPAQFVPIRFIHRNKLTKDDKLLLAFDAFVLSDMLGRAGSLGKIIHGDLRDCARSSRGNEAQTEKLEINQSLLTSAATQPRVTKVKTAALAGEVRKRLGKIAALLAGPAPPDLVLNRHCAECEFQSRCRKLAVEKDDLSLLAGMSAKERQKLRSKGIFTVTQLSYTFRPRRRPKRQRDKREKYHHALKALAIREQKIHLVGSPELKLEGTPVYLDVEGLPDRDFYYLIGVRIGHGDSAVQHSLWADTVADEGKIWREFLAILETVEQPVLIHYGSYETTFLTRMADRFAPPTENSIAANAIAKAVNVISVTFAHIYFPSLSNGLKDVARTLGYKWSAGITSGLESIAWRYRWEQSSDDNAKSHLVIYNAQDCEALSLVTQTIRGLVGCAATENPHQTAVPQFVRADIPKRPDGHKWGDFKSPVEGFETINAAARWNYQRHRIYARTGQAPGKVKKKKKKKIKNSIDQVVILSVSLICPKCKCPIRQKASLRTRIDQDLIFGRNSLKRRVVKYFFQTYRCKKCQTVYGFDERFKVSRRFGWNLISYFLYHIIEFSVPQQATVNIFNRLFGFAIYCSVLNKLKSKSSGYYAETKQAILKSIAEGTLVHADETRANIRGTDGFVWVLTNMREVFYYLADSREAEIIQQLLPKFKGVLVSDFYTAYDSLDCPQQRCLIHLMRDLNGEVLNNPFDEQFKGIVTSFANLLKPIVETVDRHGLKKHFLKKYNRQVERFFINIEQSDYQSEAALKCKDRLERNRNKLFTFLNYDGVPWNNNNAEHAIKAFARIREVVGGNSTKEGLEEYLTLLSVCQTCKYMGVDFLDFLRSGEKDIHAFAESRRRRKRPAPTRPPSSPNS